MDWIPLTSEDQLTSIIEQSFVKPVAIFKHSTRCGVSSMARKRIESEWAIDKQELPFYYLDLLRYRDISNRIADELNVHHESPQVLLIRDGKCIFNASHDGVDAGSIKAALDRQ